MSTTLEALAAHPFGHALGPADRAVVASHTRRVTLPAGRRLAHEGDPVEASWLICQGRVLLKAGRRVVESIEPGELVGWSWIHGPERPWPVDAKVTQRADVVALRLDGAGLRRAFESDPGLGFRVCRLLLLQAQRRLGRARLAHLDVFGAPR